MNLYKVNLNLLKVFHVLMQEQHISRAASKLFLTQPAVSSSLQQLREIFQDELLIRSPKKMIPTKKALLLAPKVSLVLEKIECILSFQDEFDYKTSERSFTLGMSDYSEFIILPKLYQYLHENAPHISLRIVTCSDFTPEKFEQYQIDLGIGIFKEKEASKQLASEPIFTDCAVCVGRIDNPLFAMPLTLESYLKAEHLTIHIHSYVASLIDLALRERNLSRNVKIIFSSIMPALETLAHSDLVATVPKNIAVYMANTSYPLKFVELPFKVPPIMVAHIWNRQQDTDAGLIWLRSIIKDVTKSLNKQRS